MSSGILGSIPPDLDRAVLPALEHFPHQEYWQAPYGILWYMLNWPFGGLSARDYMFWTGMANLPIVWLVTQYSLFLTPIYLAVSIFHLFKAPWNLSILWLTILGHYHWLFLVSAILAKLPVGNPAGLKAWQHALHAIPYKNSWFYYATLGIVWIGVLFKI